MKRTVAEILMPHQSRNSFDREGGKERVVPVIRFVKSNQQHESLDTPEYLSSANRSNHHDEGVFFRSMHSLMEQYHLFIRNVDPSLFKFDDELQKYFIPDILYSMSRKFFTWHVRALSRRLSTRKLVQYGPPSIV